MNIVSHHDICSKEKMTKHIVKHANMSIFTLMSKHKVVLNNYTHNIIQFNIPSQCKGRLEKIQKELITMNSQLFSKVKALVGSIRFWILTLTAAIIFLKDGDTNGFTYVGLLDILYKYLLAVVGVGTLDSVAQKFGKSFATLGNKKK